MKTQCPHCKVTFNTSDANAGRQAKCPKCAKPFTIQSIAEAPARKPAAPVPTPQKPVQHPAPSARPPEPPAAAKAPQPQAAPQTPPRPAAPPVQKAPPATVAEPIVETPASKALPKKTLPKVLYVYAWLAIRVLAGILAAAGLMLALGEAASSTVLATFAAADLFLLAGVAIELLLFYKMWDAIPTTQASTSPGKAVAFLFIPGFNIYWALLMLTAFTEDCNAQLRRSPVQVKELPSMLYAAHAFTFLLSGIFIVIPLLCTLIISHFVTRVHSNVGDLFLPLVVFAAIIGLAHLITYTLTAIKTCAAVNALQEKE